MGTIHTEKARIIAVSILERNLFAIVGAFKAQAWIIWIATLAVWISAGDTHRRGV